MRQRNTETEESLAKRLAAARADMESSECVGVAIVPHPPPQQTTHLPEVRGRGKSCYPLALCHPLPTSGSEPGLFDLIIINDSLDKAYWTLKEALSEVGSARGQG